MYSLKDVKAISKVVPAIKIMADKDMTTNTFKRVNLKDNRSSKVSSLSITKRYLWRSFFLNFLVFFFFSAILQTKLNKIISLVDVHDAKVRVKTVILNFNY